MLDLPPVDCYPSAYVQWLDTRGAVLARTADRHHITASSQLVVLDVRYDLDNNAVFRATATNRLTLQTISASPLYVLRVQREYSTLHTFTPVSVLPACLSWPSGSVVDLIQRG